MKPHPEKKQNEIWLGNYRIGGLHPSTLIEQYLKHLKTIRLGVQAYDIEGKELPQEIYRPMFIDKSEFAEYDRIMTKISSRHFNGKL
jgi:hypothetical protein